LGEAAAAIAGTSMSSAASACLGPLPLRRIAALTPMCSRSNPVPGSGFKQIYAASMADHDRLVHGKRLRCGTDHDQAVRQHDVQAERTATLCRMHAVK